MFNYIELKDINNDKVKDIMVIYNDGPRANPTYHLYLTDTVKRIITYVNGFEELRNAELDTINNIVVSSSLYGGSVGYEFYRINKNNKLVTLWHRVDAPIEDTVKYKQAIKGILKKWGK